MCAPAGGTPCPTPVGLSKRVSSCFAHGSCLMWREAGKLLAIAGQSVLVVPPIDEVNR